MRTCVRLAIPYVMFRSALDSGNLERVILLARDMPPMRLDDALRVVLLMRDGSEQRYEAACVRWLGRFALEGRDVKVEDVQEAAEVLGHLRSSPASAMEQLLELCMAHGVARSG